MKRILVIAVACLLLLTSCAASGGGNSLSKGIDFLIARNKLEKCTRSGVAIMFEKSEFEDACGGKLAYAVISSLPDAATGTLTLSGTPVKEGQTVLADELDLLRYTPCGSIGSVSEFSVKCRDGYGVESTVSCLVTLTEFENLAPVASDVSITTLSGVPKQGSLNFSDPNGDSLTLSVDTYPSHGSLQLLKDGSFVYTPELTYTGEDKMKYTVTDTFGLSCSAELKISVSPNPKAIVFGDVDADIHYDCVRACLADIMTYGVEDGEYTFSPDEEINRIDFLVMLMTSCGVTDVHKVVDTLFSDDGTLSDGRKAYLAHAAEVGIVDISDKFDPYSPVTRADAAVWFARALSLPVINASVICADLAEAPAEKADAIRMAISFGIMPTYRGYFRPNSSITKGAAAQIFGNVEEYK